MSRELLPGQRTEIRVYDFVSATSSLVLSSTERLFEAPNWTPDGRHLVMNADGGLFTLELATGTVEQVDLAGLPDINNDHLVSPDGSLLYVSGRDGHLYELPWRGGSHRRVSNDHGRYKYYLHGISADGSTLSYVAGGAESGSWRTNLHTIPVAGGPDIPLTDDDAEDDGAELSNDGWLYFNSTRADGHAQLFRLRGDEVEQLTFDDRVNWFPHPFGDRLVYVSFPPGTTGHPPNLPVEIRMLQRGVVTTLVELFGGQGTLNVSSWAPDGTRFAYAAYPLES